MIKVVYLTIVLVFTALVPIVFAQNGRYDAFVSTDEGNYKAPVEVEDGEVVYVIREDGDQLRLQNAKIVDGYASGTTLDGKQVYIQVDNYSNFEGEVGRSETSADVTVSEDAGTYKGGLKSDLP